ncbi:MAG: hypothetical protein QM704_04510 [Anaeromyxobacteraceae bacterium]
MSTIYRCGAGLGCRLPCGTVQVDATGVAAWQVVEFLGGGGYMRGTIRTLDLSGRQLGETSGTQPLFPGVRGFQLAGDLPTVLRVDEAGNEAPLAIPWPIRWGSWFWPAYYGAPGSVGADGMGSLAVTVSGLATDGAGELWSAVLGPDGAVRTPPFRVLSLPTDATGTWDRAGRESDLVRAIGPEVAGLAPSGETLVLWAGVAACNGGGVAGRWFGTDGAPLGPVFRAADALPASSELVALPDGSLALRALPSGDGTADGTWLRRFHPAVPTGAAAAPPWLLARAGERLVRAGKGGVALAIRSACAAESRRPRIDIVDPGGGVCATLELPAQGGCANPQTGAVGTGFPALGLDGTVVQFSRGLEIPLPAGNLDCRFSVWPRALAPP